MIHQRFELSESNPTDVIIFSDAKSALEAHQNPPHQDQITSEIALGISNLIAAHAVHVTLQWIPGHCNISGNEKADKLAKIGSTKPQKIPPCTQNTIKKILKNNEKEDWLNRWACGSTGRVMFKEMAQPRPQDAINQLERQDQSLIFSLEPSIQEQTNTLTGLIHYTNHIAATVTTQLKPQNTFYCTAPTYNLREWNFSLPTPPYTAPSMDN